MGAGYSSGRIWLFGSVLALALPVLAPSGHATTQDPKKASGPTHNVAHASPTVSDAHHTVPHTARPVVRQASTHAVTFRPLDLRHDTSHQAALHQAISRFASPRGAAISRASSGRYRVAGISCVPYARTATGITLAGNAWQWWDHAAGTYQRGWVPEPGGVLAFRANGRMRLGHVAVVTRVVNPREIEIDHANWAGRGVALSVPVVDVSENNDWTAVRVGLGRSDSFGSVYPTYGFIYDRPDTGNMVTPITVPAVQQALNPPPRDLRPAAERATLAVARADTRQYDEVAEAPSPSHTLPSGRGQRGRGSSACLTGDRH